MAGRRSLTHVRERYGVPAQRGMRVVANGRPGTITCADGHHLMIRLDGEKRSGRWHPTWEIDYGDGIDYGALYDARVEAFNRITRCSDALADEARAMTEQNEGDR